jgi:hypothetical protein
VIKSKTIKIALIVILLFSNLNIALVMAQCPTCQGTGKIVCPHCKGTGQVSAGGPLEPCSTCLGSGVVTPNIANKGATAWTSDGTVVVRASFENEEDVVASGTVVAEVDASATTYTSSSESTNFPPHETIAVTITIEGISLNDYRYLSSQKYLRVRVTVSEVGEITCPDCDGTGSVSSTQEDCPYCDGTGLMTCPDCGGSGTLVDGGGGAQNDETSSFAIDGAIVGVGIVAAAAIVIVVAVKKKRVTEKGLRKLSSTDFQNWVVQRLSGRTSSVRDSGMGIDAYTTGGNPIQIKQVDNVDKNVIDSFAAAMGRIKARNGTIVAFSFSEDAYKGVIRAKIHYRIEIKLVTVKELIERRAAIPL